MIKFNCRWCNQLSTIDRFRSRHENICKPCYLKHAAEKARRPNGRYLRLRYNAKKQGVAMTITQAGYEKYLDLNCHYCGLPVSGRSSIDAKSNSGSGLDRKIPGSGYTPDNVVPSCFLCNRTKSDWFSYVEMLELGKAIRTILDKRPVIDTMSQGR